jgi:hypothetical protein
VNLTAARQALAAVLSTVEGVTVRARPVKAAPTPGDGWVSVDRIAPADYSSCSATLSAVVVLAADELLAEERLEQLGVALVDAATSDLGAYDVALQPELLVVGTTAAPLYSAVLTLTLPVDNSVDES